MTDREQERRERALAWEEVEPSYTPGEQEDRRFFASIGKRNPHDLMIFCSGHRSRDEEVAAKDAEIERLTNKLNVDSQNFQIECLKAEIERLNDQINRLATVILAEFGGPTHSEGACDTAIRKLRVQAAEIERLRTACNAALEYVANDGGVIAEYIYDLLSAALKEKP